ncbi:hypothetical protein RFI_16335, partial [Reticulomyxa filosa]
MAWQPLHNKESHYQEYIKLKVDDSDFSPDEMVDRINRGGGGGAGTGTARAGVERDTNIGAGMGGGWMEVPHSEDEIVTVTDSLRSSHPNDESSIEKRKENEIDQAFDTLQMETSRSDTSSKRLRKTPAKHRDKRGLFFV